MSWDIFNEDENDIFSGTPKSKFWDIANQANDEVFKEVFDLIVERHAIMEQIIQENSLDDELEKALKTKPLSEFDKLENHKKGLYMDFTTEIVQRLDS